MTQAAAVELLLFKFEKFGIDRDFLTEQFENMKKNGSSVQRIYNCLRFMFASDFGTQEIIEKGDDPNDYFECVDADVSFAGIEVIST